MEDWWIYVDTIGTSSTSSVTSHLTYCEQVSCSVIFIITVIVLVLVIFITGGGE